MRIDAAISLIIVFASLAALPGASQNTNVGGARSHATINSVVVAERGDAIDVEISFTELVQPAVRRLEHPDRLIFDFAGCELAELGQRFDVRRGSIQAVSTEVSGVARPVASVVIELGSASSREQASAGKLVVSLRTDGNKLIVELSSAAKSASRPPASRGDKVAAQKPPVAAAPDRSLNPAPPKSAEAPPMPTMPARDLKSEHADGTSAAVIPPMPNFPSVVLKSEGAALDGNASSGTEWLRLLIPFAVIYLVIGIVLYGPLQEAA